MRWIRLMPIVAAVVMQVHLSTPMAFAQAADANAASGDKAGWAMGYILVILGVALGLAGVCRPGNRTAEIKRTDDEE